VEKGGGSRIATPGVNINLYNSTDEAVTATAALRRSTCSDRPPANPTCWLAFHLPDSLYGAVCGVGHYLGANQVLRRECDGSVHFFLETQKQGTKETRIIFGFVEYENQCRSLQQGFQAISRSVACTDFASRPLSTDNMPELSYNKLLAART
jgi:hypothetical protein